eukprot:SAG11_NODE_159_length_14027_cov_6.893667_13_plen_55_part_00
MLLDHEIGEVLPSQMQLSNVEKDDEDDEDDEDDKDNEDGAAGERVAAFVNNQGI